MQSPPQKGPPAPCCHSPAKKMILRAGRREIMASLSMGFAPGILSLRHALNISPIVGALGDAGGSRFRDGLDIDDRALHGGGGDGEYADGGSGRQV